MIENLEVVDFNVDATNVTQVKIRRSDGSIQTFNRDIPSFITGTFTQNGTYTCLPNTGWDTVTVDVPITGKTETVNVVLNQNAQTILPSPGYDSIGAIKVPNSTLVDKTVELLPTNQVITASSLGYFGISSVTVPGYDSLMTPCRAIDLAAAGISLGMQKTVTPQKVFGQDTNIKAFSSFELPNAALQNKKVEFDTSEYTIRPDEGLYYGLREVTVPSILTVLDEVTVTENGEIPIPAGKFGFSKVVVNVDQSMALVQDKMLEDPLTETKAYHITPDEGYAGMSSLSFSVNVTKTLYKYDLLTYMNGEEITADWDPSASYGVDYQTMQSLYLSQRIPERTGDIEWVMLDIYPLLKTTNGLTRKQVLCQHETDEDDNWHLYLYDANGFSKETNSGGGTPIYIVKASTGDINV